VQRENPTNTEQRARTTSPQYLRSIPNGIDVCVKPCVVVERAHLATAVVDEVVRYP
jgi:hypothetical protein